MSEEYFDVVDYNDNPTGKLTTKKEAHDNGHLHRVVAILVFRPNGKMLVQRHKEWDKRMDHAVGGHVHAGESYDEAAKREMLEELGLKTPLEYVGFAGYKEGHYIKHDPKVRHVYGIYKTSVPSRWVFMPNDEVDDIVEMEVEEVVRQMNTYPEKFLNGFLTTFATYLKSIRSELKIVAYGKDWGDL